MHIEEWSHDFASNTITQVKILTGPILRDQIPELNDLNISRNCMSKLSKMMSNNFCDFPTNNFSHAQY